MTENEFLKYIDDLISWVNARRNHPLILSDLGADTAVKALREYKQYRAIGTVEECREAREMQRGKKPILDTIYHQQYYCPNCEDFLVRKNGNKPHHCICGQAIDWSDAHDLPNSRPKTPIHGA